MPTGPHRDPLMDLLSDPRPQVAEPKPSAGANPKPPQRRIASSSNSRYNDTYTIQEQEPNNPSYWKRVGMAEVQYHKAWGDTHYWNDEHGGWVHGAEHASVPEARKLGEQGELFHHQGGPHEAEVHLMEVNKSATGLVPTLLGVMQNRAYAKGFPQGLSTPTDLSPHSSKLIGNLQARGIVPKNRSTEVTNDMDFPDEEYGAPAYRHEKYHDPISAEEHAAGRKTTRDTLRVRPRTQASSERAASDVHRVGGAMPSGPKRQGSTGKPVGGSRAVWGQWHGGPNYAGGEAEQFSSKAHARRVFQSRIEGYDPVQGLKTPLVSDSEMHIYKSNPAESSDPYPDFGFKQTKKGIRTERY